MDEGFVQLLFVLILMFASLLDVVGRGKRRRRGPTGEPSEDEPPPEVRRPQRRPQERQVPRAPRSDPTGAQTSTPPQGTETAAGRRETADKRETADTLVPEDLWAILTGEAPPTRVPRPREPEAEPWSEEEDRWTGEGVPYPREGETTEAETWRPEVTPEELPTVEAPVEVLPEDERRRSTAPRPTAPRPWIPAEIRPASGWARVPASTPAVVQRAAPSAPLAGQPRGRSPASRYADLLRTGSAAGRLDSLRTAIVLREVLERPLALRPFRNSELD